MFRNLLFLAIVFILGACSSNVGVIVVPKSPEDNRKAYGDYLGDYTYSVQQIKDIDSNKDTKLLSQLDKDNFVRNNWQRGVTAWDAYLPTADIGFISSALKLSTELASATSKYWIEGGRPGDAIAPMRQGIRAAKLTGSFQQGDMLAIQLATLYSSIGMHENAKALMLDIKAGGGVPKVKLDVDPAIQPGMDAHFAELFVKIASGEEIDNEKLNKEYEFFIRAEEYNRKTRSLVTRSTQVNNALAASDYLISYHGKNLGEENYVRFFRGFLARKMFTEAESAWSRLNSILGEIQRQRQLTFFSSEQYFVSSQVIIHQLEAELRLAEGNVQRALHLLGEAESAQVKHQSDYKVQDKFLIKTFAEQGLDLRKLSAKIREAAGQYDTAYRIYGEIIAWSEQERASLPVDQRQFFFRSQSKEAYLGRIRTAARLWTHNVTSSSALDAVIEAAEAMRSRQLLETVRGDSSTAARAVTAAQLRLQLPKGTGLLQIIEAGDYAVVVWIDKETSRVTLTPIQKEWSNKIAALHAAASTGNSIDPAIAAAVAQVAFSGCSDRVSAATTIYAVLDGLMATIPLGILPVNGNYLAENAAVATLPSLALWSGNQMIGAPRAKVRSALLVADPLYNPKRSLDRFLGGSDVMRSARGAAELAAFSPLPETRVEVQRIATMFPSLNTALLFGKEAAESQVKKMPLQPYNVLHFATHGILGGEVPMLSEPALVLSYEESEDGFLTASEVSKLKLDSDLVVLSACNTGSGVYIDGEGINGLGRAFVVAGSKQVLVSLWPVDSAATVELMTQFYKHLNSGVDANKALQRAQNEMRKSGNSAGSGQERALVIKAKKGIDRRLPFYWAPFVLLTTI